MGASVGGHGGRQEGGRAMARQRTPCLLQGPGAGTKDLLTHKLVYNLLISSSKAIIYIAPHYYVSGLAIHRSSKLRYLLLCYLQACSSRPVPEVHSVNAPC